MSSPIISVIIPAYNAAHSVAVCLESLVNQKDSTEIIVIDDGSTDATAKICKDFASVFSGVLKVISIPNSGVSIARNVGLKASCGKYIFFADADDLLEPDAFHDLAIAADRDNSDWVCADFYSRYDDSKRFLCSLNLPSPCIKGKDSILSLIRNYLDTPRGVSLFTNVWGKLYRRQLIQNHKIFFSPDMKTWEDTLFNCQYAAVADIVSYVKKPVYNYNVNCGVSSGGTSILEQPFGHRQIINALLEILRGRGENETFLKSLQSRAEGYFAVKNLLSTAKLVKEEKVELKDLYQLAEQYCSDGQCIRELRKYRSRKGESFWVPFFLKLNMPRTAVKCCMNKMSR